MNERVLVLGAGFGGLELSTMLSEAGVEVTLIDCSDAFVFGYSKLDMMFGRTSREAVRLPYDEIAKPGLRMLRETVTAIDPHARRVTTDAGVHEAARVVVSHGRARLGAVERSVPSTTQTAEKPALTNEQRAERLQRLAERLRSADGLDHDALAQIEELNSDEQ